jgi:hypothetical protein
MKINVEIDLTPEELRRFMGLPDVQGWQQQMIDSFIQNLQNSQEQQQEFVANLLSGAMAPWQSFFNPTGAAPSGKSKNT